MHTFSLCPFYLHHLSRDEGPAQARLDSRASAGDYFYVLSQMDY